MSQQKPQTWDKLLAQEAKRLRRDAQRRASGEKVFTHVPTSFKELDEVYGGVRIGIVTELMAHTGDGKSAFLRQCAEGAARAGCGVLWFVGEDPLDATAERQLSGDTGISTTSLGRLDITGSQAEALDRAAVEAAPWARYILPVFESQTVGGVLDAIDGVTTINGAPLQLVLIDYAQVLGETDNMEADIAKLGQGLHDRSRARGFATMVGSQVATPVISRGREAWFKKADITQIRPSLGDTEWCRRLEKLSKAVWALFRPNRWKREFGEECQDDHAELHVIKANFGPMGWVRLNWDGPSCRFS